MFFCVKFHAEFIGDTEISKKFDYSSKSSIFEREIKKKSILFYFFSYFLMPQWNQIKVNAN